MNKVPLPWNQGDRIRIGSDPRCHVQLALPEIAAQHVELHQLNESVYSCRALDHAPVFLNGNEILEAEMESGDLLQLGSRDHPLSGSAFLFRGDYLEPYAIGSGVAIQSLRVEKPDGNPVLNDLTFAIEPGEFVGIFGPSGCGKTTLVESILGHSKPEMRWVHGEVALNRTYPVGYVSQHDLLYLHLTVRENLETTLRISSPALDEEESANRIEDVISLLKLEKVANQPVGKLSGGQKKRVHVATELIRQPRILILDEPTSGLDPHTQRELTEHLKDLAKRRAVAIIVVSHALETLPYYDKVVILRTLKENAPDASSLIYEGASSPDTINQKLQTNDLTNVFSDGFPPEISIRSSSETGASMTMPPESRRPEKDVQQTGDWNDSRTRIQAVITLCLRHLHREPARLLFSISLPILLGLLIALALRVYQVENPPSGGEYVWILPSLMLALAGLWVGMSLTIREIVDERSLFSRNVRNGLGWADYLVGKICFAIAIATGQAFLLTLTLSLFLKLSPIWMLFPVTALVSIGGAIIGLIISAVARSSAAAILMMPLLLIPHLLFNVTILEAQRTLNELREIEPPTYPRYAAVADLSEARIKEDEAWLSDRLHARGSLLLLSRPAIATATMAQSRSEFRKDPASTGQRYELGQVTAEFAYLVALVLAHLLLLLGVFRLQKDRLAGHLH